MVKFEKFSAVCNDIYALQLTEELWEAINKNGSELISGNILTAFEEHGYKVFFFADEENVMKDGVKLYLGEWIVIREDQVFIYDDQDFRTYFKEVGSVSGEVVENATR